MGVDARMMVKLHRRENWLTEDQVRQLSYELASSVGAEQFCIVWNGDFDFWPNGRHALEIKSPLSKDEADDYESPELEGEVVWHQDGDPVIAAQDEQFIEVHLSGRYYGEGYERGNWPVIKSIVEWLRIRIPYGTIYYGGDSSGICLEHMDTTAVARLTRHWAINGRRPYVHYGYRSGNTIDCPHCKAPMANCGGGRGYDFLWCDGCDRKASKHVDGRLVWAKRFHDYPTLNEQGEFEQRKDTFR